MKCKLKKECHCFDNPKCENIEVSNSVSLTYGALMLISFALFMASWVWFVVMLVMMLYGFNFSLWPIFFIIFFFILFGVFGRKSEIERGGKESSNRENF